MEGILNRINKYIEVKEKNDSIELSLKECSNLETAIDLYKKSSNKEKTVSLFSKEIKEEIKTLIDGGLLNGFT